MKYWIAENRQEDRQIAYRFFAILDYLRDVHEKLNLPYLGDELSEETVEEERVEKGKKKEEIEYELHEIRVTEVIQFFRDRGIKAKPEWEEGISLFNKGNFRCRPDFFVMDKRKKLYGEVGDFSLDKVNLFYRDEQLIWISKKKWGWEKIIYYFDKGIPYLMTLEESFSYFIKRKKEEVC